MTFNRQIMLDDKHLFYNRNAMCQKMTKQLIKYQKKMIAIAKMDFPRQKFSAVAEGSDQSL